MYVWNKHPVFMLWVGLCSLPIMVAAQGPGDLTRQRPALIEGVPEMVIPAGPHYLTTWPGTTTTRIELPADFFFPGSDPVDLIVLMEGNPIGPVPGRRDGFKMKFARLVEPGDDIGDSGRPDDAPYDTVMIQHQDAALSRIGSQTRVDLTMEDVRLRSVAPVEVTGTETRYYDVFLQVTSHHQNGREATTGSMTYKRDGIATGNFTAEVFAWAQYTFVPQDGGEPIVYDHDGQLTIGTRTPTPFFIPALHPGRAWTEHAHCCKMCHYVDTESSSSACHCSAPPP